MKRYKGSKNLLLLTFIMFIIWLAFMIWFIVKVSEMEMEVITYTTTIEVVTSKDDELVTEFPIEEEIVLQEIPVCHPSAVKSYMDYRMITARSSKQWRYIHESGNITIKDGFLWEDDFIGVALGSYFGPIGSKYSFHLDTGIVLHVVKVEAKADIHTNNGCEQRWDTSVIEFVIDSQAFTKEANGYVNHGNFNNSPQFRGNIVAIYKHD